MFDFIRRKIIVFSPVFLAILERVNTTQGTTAMETYTVEQTLASLRSNVESDHNLPGFGTVYLDNARLPGQSDKQFRAHLSALSKRGDYKIIDGYAFGAVRM